VWGAALLLLVLYLAPVLVSFCLPDPRGGVPWHQARRDPTGLSPDPAVTQEAVIQVFAAPAVSWRGVFSVHTWIAVKPTGAPRFTRYEVLGFGVANGAPTLRIDRMGPDNYWFGARPQILLDRRGAGVDGMIPRVRDAVASYPYPSSYRPWPGPKAIPSSRTSPGRSPNWSSTSLRMQSVRISCRTAACSLLHPADPAFRYRFTGSRAFCSPLARDSR
jgi:hypothetical protein